MTFNPTVTLGDVLMLASFIGGFLMFYGKVVVLLATLKEHPLHSHTEQEGKPLMQKGIFYSK